MSSIISLKDRHTDATQKLILATAVELLETGGVSELTVRAVAKRAGMSERTIFRYFPTREDFLDAVASEAVRGMHTPAPPANIDELLGYADQLYRSFEARSALVVAGLHTDLIKRVRQEAAEERWRTIHELINDLAPGAPESRRSSAATNISYFLSASTWHYYRANFALSLDDTIACATAAIRVIVDDLRRA